MELFDLNIHFPVTDPTWIFFLVLIIILFAPMILGRLRIPHIIGMILAGVVVGKYGFNILERDSSFELFGKVGLYYIMFLAGLEMDMDDFKKNRTKGLIFGMFTFLIPMGLGIWSSMSMLDYGFLTSVLLASMYASHTLIAYPIISIVSSCSEEEDCSMNARPMMQCYLYKIDGETERVVNDTLDSLTITAFGTDSIILNNQKRVHGLSLPLRYTADSTVLVFHYSKDVKIKKDTIVIRQKNTPYFLSMDCGYQMKQSITGRSYSRHLLDSIYIQTAEVSIYGTENLKLFYRN